MTRKNFVTENKILAGHNDCHRIFGQIDHE